MRGFSTDIRDHEGLVRNMARKALGRLIENRVVVDFEDVYQDMCVSFVKAAQTYDPDRGITFSAYMGRAAYNNFNRTAERMINDARICPITVEAIEDLATIQGGDNTELSQSALEVLSQDTIESAEESYARKETMRETLALLSPTTRSVIAELLFSADAEEVEPIFSRRLTMVCTKHGLDSKGVAKLRKEIHSKLGVRV